MPGRMRRASDASRHDEVALALAGIAALVASLSLLGWVFQVPALASFGANYAPAWPLTTAGYLLLSFAMVMAILGRHGAAVAAVAVLILVAIVVGESTSGIRPGIDRLLFSQQLAGSAAANPGRPGSNSLLSFVSLAAAILIAQRQSPLLDRIANVLAALALCLGLYSTTALMWIHHAAAFNQFFVAPLPAGLASLAIACSFLWWKHEAGWTGLLSGDRMRQPLDWLVLPILFVLPAVPIVLEQWSIRTGTAPPEGAPLIAILVNMLIIGTILLLVSDRLTRQRLALSDLSDALDSAAIALVGSDGTILHWTQGCVELYGWSAEDAVGRNKHDLVQSREVESHTIDVAQEDAPPRDQSEAEFVERRRDGAELHVVERRRLLHRPGLDDVVVLKMLDITTRVKAEEDLRVSENRLAIAAEVNEIGVFDWDIASGRISWSPGSEQRLGLSAGAIDTFDKWRDHVEPAEVADVMASIDSAVADRRDRFSFQYQFFPESGRARMLEGNARCLYDDRGNLVRSVGSIIDATQRNRREAEMRLDSMIETVPDATIVIDEFGVIKSFSRVAEAMFGYPAEDAIGCNIKMLMPDGLAAQHDSAIIDYIQTGDRKVIGKTRELTARRADGTPFPVELNVGETRIGDERIFTGIIRDVSRRLLEEQRLSELSAELAHISRQRAMSELAADLAHELNQPLSATANFIAAARMLIEQGGGGERVADLLHMAEEQTQRSGDIIRRLRDFLAKRDIEMRSESLDAVVRDAVALVFFGSGREEIELIYDLDPTSDTIFADRVQIQQVLVNLLRNAVEALRALDPGHPRQIVIQSQSKPDDLVELAIMDTGPGIPEALSEQLYGRFSTTKSGTAMGIGLSISRRIVEAHGGVLTAENQPDGGAVFRFTLPVFKELEDDPEHLPD
ncbi:MAG TPA: PAS domain S-box protein [Sphingomonas sp.]|nr:PAS domain S-box protein [Sphingomonas sp.]